MYKHYPPSSSAQFSSLAQSYLTLCNPMNHSTPSLPVHHQLPEFTQTRVHWVGDTIQPSHPLSSTSHPTLNLSQHQDLFKWVSSSHEVAKVLEFQLQHQSYQWTPRTDLLWDGLVWCVLNCFSRVQPCVTLWTIARQAPLSMGFSRLEPWSGLPCPPPGDLPDPGIEPASLMSPALAGGFFTASASWEDS